MTRRLRIETTSGPPLRKRGRRSCGRATLVSRRSRSPSTSSGWSPGAGCNETWRSSRSTTSSGWSPGAGCNESCCSSRPNSSRRQHWGQRPHGKHSDDGDRGRDGALSPRQASHRAGTQAREHRRRRRRRPLTRERAGMWLDFLRRNCHLNERSSEPRELSCCVRESTS